MRAAGSGGPAPAAGSSQAAQCCKCMRHVARDNVWQKIAQRQTLSGVELGHRLPLVGLTGFNPVRPSNEVAMAGQRLESSSFCQQH